MHEPKYRRLYLGLQKRADGLSILMKLGHLLTLLSQVSGYGQKSKTYGYEKEVEVYVSLQLPRDRDLFLGLSTTNLNFISSDKWKMKIAKRDSGKLEGLKSITSLR